MTLLPPPLSVFERFRAGKGFNAPQIRQDDDAVAGWKLGEARPNCRLSIFSGGGEGLVREANFLLLWLSGCIKCRNLLSERARSICNPKLLFIAADDNGEEQER